MTHVFEKRRSRLQAMKELHESYIPPKQMLPCPGCHRELPRAEVERALSVCPACGHHFPIGSAQRLAMVMDGGKYREQFRHVTAHHAPDFPGYAEKLREAREKTGLSEAVVVVSGTIDGHACVACVLDSRFMTGSMGEAVGEKLTRAIEYAARHGFALVVFSASGGARLQEGILSLMQMAKTSAALRRLSEKGLLYVSVLTDPTMGGVTASFTSLGDVILAEPGALIGFADPRVIEQTLGQSLPEGFQRAEFLMEHGFIDAIVPRSGLRDALGELLALHEGGNTCSKH